MTTKVSHQPMVFNASGRLLLMLWILVVSICSSVGFTSVPIGANAALQSTTTLAATSRATKQPQEDIYSMALSQLEGKSTNRSKSGLLVDFVAASAVVLPPMLFVFLLFPMHTHTHTGSSMVYGYAFLRKYVSNTTLNGEQEWTRPELILTQTRTEFLKTGYNNYLKYNVTADAIYDFLCEPNNAKLLSNTEEIKEFFAPNSFDVKAMNETVAKLRAIGGHLVEFNDERDKSDLVYGISVSWEKKRITVAFRGSVKNTMDWTINRKLLYIEDPLPKPEQLANERFHKDGDIKVHRGFHCESRYVLMRCTVLLSPIRCVPFRCIDSFLSVSTKRPSYPTNTR